MTAPTTDATSDLETGWSPNTPSQDTVLRRGVLALAAAWETVGQASGVRTIHDDRFHAVDTGRPTGLFNSATLLQPLRDDGVASTADQIERFYDQAGHGAALLWSPWSTPDLTARGWTLQGHPPLLYRPAGVPVVSRERDGLEITEVSTSGQLAAWSRLAVKAFPLGEVDPPDGLLDPAVLRDPRFRFTAARVSGRDVAVACQVIVDGANVLLLGTTLPEARGHGYYAALIADRLARHPDLPAVTIVSDDSRPVLVERFGFLPISRFTLWERQRP